MIPQIRVKNAKRVAGKKRYMVMVVGRNNEILMHSETLNSLAAVRKNYLACWLAFQLQGSPKYFDAKTMLK
jgi:hypothetical protein